ncbi:MAG TPA: helix-turn-helix domain-containing protein [Trebonia sp.]
MGSISRRITGVEKRLLARRRTLLKVKKSWNYDEVEAGRLDALRLGKQLRFRPSDLARYLDERAKASRGAQRN